jgi:hypothetical protein
MQTSTSISPASARRPVRNARNTWPVILAALSLSLALVALLLVVQ